MRIVAVTSTVVFEIPDDRWSIDQIRQHFKLSNEVAIGVPMTTLSGLPYVMLDLPRLEVTERRA